MINIDENNDSSKKNNKIIEINEFDKTFNKLRDLQSLIKKESALKQLCKKKYINIYNKIIIYVLFF